MVPSVPDASKEPESVDYSTDQDLMKRELLAAYEGKPLDAEEE